MTDANQGRKEGNRFSFHAQSAMTDANTVIDREAEHDDDDDVELHVLGCRLTY